MGAVGGAAGAELLEEVKQQPASFALVLSGHHDHPDCNGRYAYDGKENGKPKWSKVPGGAPNLFWTGHSWDCFWGGYSPESPAAACTTFFPSAARRNAPAVRVT